MIENFISIATFSAIGLNTFIPAPTPARVEEKLIISKEYSINNIFGESYTSGVYRDNILLSMAYLNGKVKKDDEINWTEVRKPFKSEFELKPKEGFAFHDDILSEYVDRVVKTTNAHFGANEGFRSNGYLYGIGVCNLASYINVAAREAKLDVYAPTDHSFAPIPEVSYEYGVSIYNEPQAQASSQNQNLYITNNKQNTVKFKFDYNGEKIKISIVEEIE